MLLIGATHGDEPIGIEVAEKMRSLLGEDKIGLVVGNPRAYELGRRFVEADLNRIYPGDIRSDVYEEGLAADNLKRAKQYDWIIDVHETKYSSESFVVIPWPEIPNKEFVKVTGFRKVILWPSTSGRDTGSIAQFLDNAIEIEISVKEGDREKIVSETAGKLIGLLKWTKGEPVKDDQDQVVYKVYGKISEEEWRDRAAKNKIRDFEEIQLQGERFVPLFTDQYLSKGIKCYKMKIFKKEG